MNVRRVAEDSGKAIHHPTFATDDLRAECRVSLVQPRRETNAARHAVEFGDRETRFGQQTVWPQDARQIVLERVRALELDEFRWLPLIEKIRNPRRLFARDALAIEQIDRAIKLEEHAPEGIQLLRQICPERKRHRRDAPGLIREQAAGRKSVADVGRSIGWRLE